MAQIDERTNAIQNILRRHWMRHIYCSYLSLHMLLPNAHVWMRKTPFAVDIHRPISFFSAPPSHKFIVAVVIVIVRRFSCVFTFIKSHSICLDSLLTAMNRIKLCIDRKNRVFLLSNKHLPVVVFLAIDISIAWKATEFGVEWLRTSWASQTSTMPWSISSD